jgi:ribosomal-protein-alanine N-acetyltransferase
MEIRRAAPKDVSDIARAEEICFSDPWCERDILNYVSTEGGMVFVAIRDGAVVAYILGRLIPPEAEIYRIAVLPEFRRRGIGYRLLDFAMKTERGHGLETAFLEVRSQNLPAINLYSSYGFVKAGLRKKYYKNPDDDAIVMLRAHPDDLKN